MPEENKRSKIQTNFSVFLDSDENHISNRANKRFISHEDHFQFYSQTIPPFRNNAK